MSGFAASAPYDPYEGSFTVTWDNAQDSFDQTSGIVLHNLTASIGSAIAFSYIHTVDRLVVGGIQNSVPSIGSDTDDFALAIDHASSDNAAYGGGAYTRQGIDAFFTPQEGVASQVAPAPEPATWATMILGLAGVGATLRRRRPAAA